MKQVYLTKAWITEPSPSTLEQITDPGFDRLFMSRLDMSGHGWICLGEAKIEVELDTDDLPQQAIRALQIKREELMARTQRELNLIEGEIRKLQSLPLLVDPSE